MPTSNRAIRRPFFALFASVVVGACSAEPLTSSRPTPPDYERPAQADPSAADIDAPPPPSATAEALATAAPVVPPTASAIATSPPATTVSSATTDAAGSRPPAPTDDLPVDGANLTVGSLTADGFTLTNLACKVEGGGFGMLMMGPAIAGSLSKKKAALDACAPKGADVRARFTMAGGKVTTAEAKAGDPKIEACVVRTLKTAPAAAEGTCAASMHLGK